MRIQILILGFEELKGYRTPCLKPYRIFSVLFFITLHYFCYCTYVQEPKLLTYGNQFFNNDSILNLMVLFFILWFDAAVIFWGEKRCLSHWRAFIKFFLLYSAAWSNLLETLHTKTKKILHHFLFQKLYRHKLLNCWKFALVQFHFHFMRFLCNHYFRFHQNGWSYVSLFRQERSLSLFWTFLEFQGLYSKIRHNTVGQEASQIWVKTGQCNVI